MNPTKPVVACFVFQDPFGILVVKRWWEGVEYIGLPADEIPQDEPLEDCAKRTIAPQDGKPGDIALIRQKGLGESTHIGTDEDCQWNGQPVTLSVFSFPDADIVAPMTAMATRLVVKDDVLDRSGPPFDVTLLALQKIMEDRQKKSDSAAAA